MSITSSASARVIQEDVPGPLQAVSSALVRRTCLIDAQVIGFASVPIEDEFAVASVLYTTTSLLGLLLTQGPPMEVRRSGLHCVRRPPTVSRPSFGYRLADCGGRVEPDVKTVRL